MRRTLSHFVRVWANARTYPGAVIAVGLLVIADSIWRLVQTPPDPRWYILAVLTVFSGTARFRMPAIPFSFSISDSFTMTAALLFGAPAGTVAVAIDGLVISLRLHKDVNAHRTLFNMAGPAFAMWIAARTFFLLVGVEPPLLTVSLGRLILPLFVFACLFFVLNTGLIAGAIAWDQRVEPFALWRQHFVGLWLTYFGGAVVAALLIALISSHEQFLVLALVSPIPFILWATFRNVVGRMEDEVGHLDEVNRMHVATIETLAHAIDAKDQVTHGHIRRVQRSAVALARAIGVTDAAQIRAIEAAGLLHDIGKLAVPEHILSKPTSLTPAEFDRMKRHATIGADILATIDFPFPIVPIVRSHHENWDGTGYPDGLKGETIPLGARVLSVVDCYDAITSDRPYRSALPHDEAVRILRSRSGTMYEPRLVDRFIEIQPGLALSQTFESNDAFDSIARTARAMNEPTPRDAQERDLLAATFDLGKAIAGAHDANEALIRSHGTLKRLMPAATCALFVHDRNVDELVARFAVGRHSSVLTGLSIPRGQRLTGWVAANRQTIVNSDAALDLGNLIVTLRPTPHSCLSVPVVCGEELLGTLTIYSAEPQPFTELDAALVEVLASALAPLLYIPAREPSRESAAPRVLEFEPAAKPA